MSSDADYASFLDKANQPTTGNKASASSKPTGKLLSSKSVDDGVALPKSLTQGTEDLYYVSDADEPFEGVGLKWDGGKLDQSSFSSLISTSGSVEEIKQKDFDPRGQHTEVFEKVGQATEGGVKVFRVGGSGTRVEYWVVGIAKGGKELLGLKAKAVES